MNKWAYCCSNSTELEHIYRNGLNNPIFCNDSKLIPALFEGRINGCNMVIAMPQAGLNLEGRGICISKENIHILRGKKKKAYLSIDIYNSINQLSKTHKNSLAWGNHKPSEVWQALKSLQSCHTTVETYLVPEVIKSFATQCMQGEANVALFSALRAIKRCKIIIMETNIVKKAESLDL